MANIYSFCQCLLLLLNRAEMFQKQGLIWLAALVACSLPHGSFQINGYHDVAPSEPRGIGLGEAAVSSSEWPFAEMKFDHPIQSPVDLLTEHAVTMALPVLDIVEPDQPGVNCSIYNSGHTVYIYIKEQADDRPYLIGGPLRAKFIYEQMHFHWGSEDIWGSEHLINGESFAVEMHMVHYNSRYASFEEAANKPDGLAVLTIFAEANKNDNPLLDPLYNLLPKLAEPKVTLELNSTLALQWARSALTLNHEYYTYPGSLTTPPYSENVIFILLPKPIKLSHLQLAAFRELHSEHKDKILDNKRQVQPLHRRPVVRSTQLH